eukprot:EG_transcript_62865
MAPRPPDCSAPRQPWPLLSRHPVSSAIGARTPCDSSALLGRNVSPSKGRQGSLQGSMDLTTFAFPALISRLRRFALPFGLFADGLRSMEGRGPFSLNTPSILLPPTPP